MARMTRRQIELFYGAATGRRARDLAMLVVGQAGGQAVGR